MTLMGLFQPCLQGGQPKYGAELSEWDQQRNSDMSKPSTSFHWPIVYPSLAEVTHYFVPSAPNRNCEST